MKYKIDTTHYTESYLVSDLRERLFNTLWDEFRDNLRQQVGELLWDKIDEHLYSNLQDLLTQYTRLNEI